MHQRPNDGSNSDGPQATLRTICRPHDMPLAGSGTPTHSPVQPHLRICASSGSPDEAPFHISIEPKRPEDDFGPICGLRGTPGGQGLKDAARAIGATCRLAGPDGLPVVALVDLGPAVPEALLRIIVHKAMDRHKRGSQTLLMARIDQCSDLFTAFREAWPVGTLQWDATEDEDEGTEPRVFLTFGPKSVGPSLKIVP